MNVRKIKSVAALKRLDENGCAYWTEADLRKLLGLSKNEMKELMARARLACEQAGSIVDVHFFTRREKACFSEYGCSFVLQNANPKRLLVLLADV